MNFAKSAGFDAVFIYAASVSIFVTDGIAMSDSLRLHPHTENEPTTL